MLLTRDLLFINKCLCRLQLYLIVKDLFVRSDNYIAVFGILFCCLSLLVIFFDLEVLEIVTVVIIIIGWFNKFISGRRLDRTFISLIYYRFEEAITAARRCLSLLSFRIAV